MMTLALGEGSVTQVGDTQVGADDLDVLEGAQDNGPAKDGLCLCVPPPRLHYRLLTLCRGASSGPQGQ